MVTPTLSYDLHKLTPGGPVVEHLEIPGGKLETDGPFLFLFDAAGAALGCWPAHAIVEVRACEGGDGCAGSAQVR